MKVTKPNRGITLIALVITIIVMLILAGVTINLVTRGGLFDYAGNAAQQTKLARDAEQKYVESITNNLPTEVLIAKYTGTTWRFSPSISTDDLFDDDLFSIGHEYGSPGYRIINVDFVSTATLKRKITEEEANYFTQGMNIEDQDEYDEMVDYFLSLNVGETGYIKCSGLCLGDGTTGQDIDCLVDSFNQNGRLFFLVFDARYGNGLAVHGCSIKLPSFWGPFYEDLYEVSTCDIIITGGEDSQKPEFINWLQEHASQV